MNTGTSMVITSRTSLSESSQAVTETGSDVIPLSSSPSPSIFTVGDFFSLDDGLSSYFPQRLSSSADMKGLTTRPRPTTRHISRLLHAL